MPIPGEPLSLTLGEVAALEQEVEEQLSDALALHADVEEEVEANRLLYLAEPESKEKTFPWKGACNVVIPLVGTVMDSVLARIVNTIFGQDPFWSMRPLHEDFVEAAPRLEEFVEWSRKSEQVDFYEQVRDWVSGVCQNGRSWMKVPWETQYYAYYERNNEGKIVRKEASRKRPHPQSVNLTDIIVQPGVDCDEDSEWMAHRVRLTDTQMVWRNLKKMYLPRQGLTWEQIIAEKEDIGDTRLRSEDQQFSAKLVQNTIYEIWREAPIPTRKDRTPISCTLTYHRPTKSFVRMVHNPFFYGGRPFFKGEFAHVHGARNALGLAGMLRQFQATLSTIYRQQIDNATIANTRFFLGKRDRVKSGTRVWPGRFLIVQDPDKDVKAVQMGDIYQSMHALEISLTAWAEKRSGVADYQLGRESSIVGSRATFGGTMAVIQEGNRRFDLNVRDMRSVLGRVGMFELELNQQFRPKGFAYYVQDGAKWTERMLDMPREYLLNGMGVEITASTATVNKQTQQTGLISMLGILHQNLDLGQGIAMALASPQVPAEAKEYMAKGFDGIRKVTERVVQSMDQKDFDELVPGLAEQFLADIKAKRMGMPTGMPMGGMNGNSELPAGIGDLGNIAGVA